MHMHALVRTGVFKKSLKRKHATAKRDFGPGNFLFTEQSRFEALTACAEITEQGRGKKQVHLPSFDDIDRRKQVTDLHLGTGLFECLAGGALFHRLAELHEAGRYCPVSVAWLYGAAAKQDLASPFGHTTDDYSWVLVVNGVALIADPAMTIVTIRYLLYDKAAATRTMLHGIRNECCRERESNSDSVARTGF